MNKQQIYNDLDYDWWTDSQINQSGTVFQSAVLYFQDTLANWHSFTSVGCCPTNPDYTIGPTTREYYVKDYLMWETTHWLRNAQCSGGITNVKPRDYQPMPIYAK